MSKMKQLIEQASRKSEMRWKVLAFNPKKDNELVDTSKAFDCICAAQAHKRELAEKHPEYVIEIIAESIGQDIIDRVVAEVEDELKDNIRQEVKDAVADELPVEENLGAEVKDDMEAEEDELAMEEDIDDDSDSIFASDDLDEVEPESEDQFLEDIVKPDKHKLIVKHDGKVDEYIYDTKAFADKYAAEYKAKGYDVEVVKESVTKTNYNEIIKVLSDTIAKAAKKYPEAKLVKNYQATTGSHGTFLDEGLRFTDKDALSKALAVSKELQKAMSKYGFKDNIGGRLPYMMGNNRHSTIVNFGAVSQGSYGASVGYEYAEDALKFLESAQKNESNSDLTVAKAMARNANVSKDERVAHMIASLEKDLKNAKTDKEIKEIQEILALLKKKTESAQINESRNWEVLLKVSMPDNMNNKDVEDRIEELVDKHGFTVMDVTATRK